MTAWAEDRAPRRRDPSADPGAKTEGGRHDAALSFPFGIGAKAANRGNLIKRALYLISRPRFLHFTLNQYTQVSSQVPTVVPRRLLAVLAVRREQEYVVCQPKWHKAVVRNQPPPGVR